jgi:DNA-directed RNA polymerase subunit M/transcription elongation factor TFIIS
MEKCQKCSGVMLLMKTKKTVMPDAEKKQAWKCSRCGYYFEKQQVFHTSRYPNSNFDDPYSLPRKP